MSWRPLWCAYASRLRLTRSSARTFLLPPAALACGAFSRDLTRGTGSYYQHRRARAHICITPHANVRIMGSACANAFRGSTPRRIFGRRSRCCRGIAAYRLITCVLRLHVLVHRIASSSANAAKRVLNIARLFAWRTLPQRTIAADAYMVKPSVHFAAIFGAEPQRTVPAGFSSRCCASQRDFSSPHSLAATSTCDLRRTAHRTCTHVVILFLASRLAALCAISAHGSSLRNVSAYQLPLAWGLDLKIYGFHGASTFCAFSKRLTASHCGWPPPFSSTSFRVSLLRISAGCSLHVFVANMAHFSIKLFASF